VARPVRLLDENADVLRSERSRFRHVLVDEYQDVNRAGACLVRRLTAGDDGAGLWAVGDLRQAIYAFRGASPANVSGFEADFPGGRRTELGVNYRSRGPLVSFFGQVCGEGAAAWRPAREGEPDNRPAATVLAVARDDDAQADGIARRMRRFAAQGTAAFGDQVVLCRTRGQAAAMRAALTARGIPVAAVPDEGDWFARPDVKHLVALLSRAAEPEGPASHRIPDLPPGLPARGDAWEFWAQALFGPLGLARTLREPAAVARLMALARGFRERAALLLDPSEDPRRAFLAHLRRLARMGAVSWAAAALPGSVDADAVRVLTVHAAKGLEFPVVFVPNLSQGKFPSRPAPALLPALPLDDAEPVTDGGAAGVGRRTAALLRSGDARPRRPRPFPGREVQRPFGSALAAPVLPRRRRRTRPGNLGTRRRGGPGRPATGRPRGGVRRRRHRGGVGSRTIPAVPAALSLRPGVEPARRRRCRAVRRLQTHGPTGAPSCGGNARHAPFPQGRGRGSRRGLGRSGSGPRASPHPPVPGRCRGDRHALLGREGRRGRECSGHASPGGCRAPASFHVVLPNGTVCVRADGRDEAGAWERRTFRKPPKDENDAPAAAPGAPPEPRLSLLQEAVCGKRARPGPDAPWCGCVTSARERFFRSRTSPKQRAKHLAEYDRACRAYGCACSPPRPPIPTTAPPALTSLSAPREVVSLRSAPERPRRQLRGDLTDHV
jgi:hypothetical protein